MLCPNILLISMSYDDTFISFVLIIVLFKKNFVAKQTIFVS